MTHRNVETLIGKLVTDPQLRRRFTSDPVAVLRELGEEGLELNRVEREALASTDPAAIRSLAHSLDRRLRKASFETEPLTAEEEEKSREIATATATARTID